MSDVGLVEKQLCMLYLSVFLTGLAGIAGITGIMAVVPPRNAVGDRIPLNKALSQCLIQKFSTCSELHLCVRFPELQMGGLISECQLQVVATLSWLPMPRLL